MFIRFGSCSVPQDNRPSDKRGAILDAALGLIAERGFHNTPVSKIAEVSGVSAGTLDNTKSPPTSAATADVIAKMRIPQ
jgi:hypothetical protein